MTLYKQGDVALVNFGFSEGRGFKKRPTLIISGEDYHKSRQEVIVLAITSNTSRVLLGDTKITQWKKAGLLYSSLVTGIVRTIKMSVILRKLGAISNQDFQEVQKNFRSCLNF